MRSVRYLLLLLFVAACQIQCGPDCSGACDRVLECPDLDKTYRLNCNPVAGSCGQAELDCASCIEDKTCAELQAGACDSLCVVAPP